MLLRPGIVVVDDVAEDSDAAAVAAVDDGDGEVAGCGTVAAAADSIADSGATTVEAWLRAAADSCRCSSTGQRRATTPSYRCGSCLFALLLLLVSTRNRNESSRVNSTSSRRESSLVWSN